MANGIDAGGERQSRICVWDLESRSLLRSISHTSPVCEVIALDPSGRRLATLVSPTGVQLWDLDSGTALRVLPDHSFRCACMVWDASGLFLACGTEFEHIAVYNAATGELVRDVSVDLCETMDVFASFVWILVAHPTGDLYASGSSNGAVRVWRWSSDECVHALLGHSGAVASLAASAEFIVSGSADKTVRVWSWASGACLRVIDGFEQPIQHTAIAWRDSTLFTSEENREDLRTTLRVWDTSSPDPAEWEYLGKLPPARVDPASLCAVGQGRVAWFAYSMTANLVVWG